MNEASKPDDIPMHDREITLQDGRYMIFYTFGEDGSAVAPEENKSEENV